MHSRIGVIAACCDRLIEIVTSLILVAIVVINAGEIGSRTFLNAAFDWIHEVNLLLASWLYFMGIALIYYRNKDITVDFILALFRGRARVHYLVAINLVTICVLAVVLYYGWQLVVLQSAYKSMGLGIRNHWFSVPLLVGTVMMMFFVLHQSLGLWIGRAASAPRGDS